MAITVAICAYNAEKHIRKCIESLNSQTIKADEILLINDHSTDSTIKIAKELNIKVVPNEGRYLYDGRNTALKHCSNEFLAFIDSDCEADKEWIENILRIFKDDSVAAGTGRHPAIGTYGFTGWLHRMWFLVETEETGYTGGIIGGNSYFRVSALKKIGGWVSLPYSNAEDVYIALALIKDGFKLWADEKCIANHNYSDDFIGLMKKTVTSGEAITYMLKVTGFKNYVWNKTILIPVVAISLLSSLPLLLLSKLLSLFTVIFVLGGTFYYFNKIFKNIFTTLPRFTARWILIWPYSVGIIKGLLKKRIAEK